MEDQALLQRRAAPEIRRRHRAAGQILGLTIPDPGMTRMRKAMAVRRDRLDRVQSGADRQRPVQPRTARGAAQSARRGRLGARGGGRLRREAQGSASSRKPPNRRRSRWPSRNADLEVFIRSRTGSSISIAAACMRRMRDRDPGGARHLHPPQRRREHLGGAVECDHGVRSAEKGMMFEPAEAKIYRHPTFYDVPEEVGHM